MEQLSYLDLPNCYRLSNGTVELIVTTDVGPRIIRYGFPGAENMLGELPGVTITTELGDWKPVGGHRLWTAPEAKPRSYAPDNKPVSFSVEGEHAIRLTAPFETQPGIQKELTVALDATGSGVKIHHKITNRNLWGIDAALWGLTIMNGGGEAIFPQEPYRSWGNYLLPARPLVLWHYTDMSDARWTWGKKFIRLRTDADLTEPQKIGLMNKQGWAAYKRGTSLFVKRFSYKEEASYPDYGSNMESYTAGTFMEIETLSPMYHLEPDESAEHTERWYLFSDVNLGADETALDEAINSLIAKTTV